MDVISSIWGAIKSILQLLSNFQDFVLSLAGDLVKVVSLTAEAVLHLPNYLLSFLPSSFVAIIVVILSVVVVYKVIGREG